MQKVPKHVGWYDGDDEAPSHNPGFEVPCPFCGTRVGRHEERPIKTISLMAVGDRRSYFYRAHKSCHEQASPDAVTDVESIIIDGVH